MRATFLAALAACLLSAPPAFAAAAPEGPRVQAQLVSELQAVAPGATFWVALHQRIVPGWHTYWENPGDSGEPATIEWRLPAGFTAGPIQWPHPRRIPVGPFMSHGYEGEVLLLTQVTAPAALAPGTTAALRARAGWLVCEKECIPEEAEVALTLPVAAAAAPDARWAEPIARARRAVPVPSPWPAELRPAGDGLALTVAAPGLAAERLADAWFFPRRWGVIDHVAPQPATITRAGLRLDLTRGPLSRTWREPVEGVLVLQERLPDGVASHAFALRTAPDGVAAAGGSGLSLGVAVSLALAGGLLLNLMPCVLPVLAIKALALVQHAGAPGGARRQGVAYAAGVLASFAVVGGALLALRGAGEAVGWGFQLQSPVVVTALAFGFLVLALSLSGVVTIGASLVGLGHGLASRAGLAGAFFSGALSTVAATPCTAPFMGVAVGFAMTQPPATALLVFEALGLGLALPYLALSLVPGWRRWLPRPGPWMTRLERVLAVPLYATVAWLVWVLGRQQGTAAVVMTVAGLALAAAAAVLYERARAGRRLAVPAAALLALAAVTAGGLAAMSALEPARAREAGAPDAFTPRRLAELRAQGKPVLVNFTAAWCITCLVNERVVLRAPAVTAALARKDVVLLTADWTRRDPEVTRVLESFGRSGVPLYVLYSAGRAAAAPAVLPVILTEGTILDAVERL